MNNFDYQAKPAWRHLTESKCLMTWLRHDTECTCLFFNAVLSTESEHLDLLLLPNPVSAVHGLQQHISNYNGFLLTRLLF